MSFFIRYGPKGNYQHVGRVLWRSCSWPGCTDTLRSLGVTLDKRRQKAGLPSRYSTRLKLRLLGPNVAGTHADGNETEDPRRSTQRRVKQEPEDNQLRVRSRSQLQAREPDDPMEESLGALQEQQSPPGPCDRNDTREPTLDYWDPPRERTPEIGDTRVHSSSSFTSGRAEQERRNSTGHHDSRGPMFAEVPFVTFQTLHRPKGKFRVVTTIPPCIDCYNDTFLQILRARLR